VVCYASSPVVSYASPSVVSYASSSVVSYASSLVVSYTSSPVVSQASSPVVSYASSPVVSHASSPVVSHASSSVVSYASSSVVSVGVQLKERIEAGKPDDVLAAKGRVYVQMVENNGTLQDPHPQAPEPDDLHNPRNLPGRQALASAKSVPQLPTV
jgi:hypothetical protein